MAKLICGILLIFSYYDISIYLVCNNGKYVKIEINSMDFKSKKGLFVAGERVVNYEI
jgi:pSer/pThr/pTyr-binding forkhead associated (FHA) protein